MKRCIKCHLCVLLAMLLGLCSATALAEEKKETVYIMADALGQPQRVFISERSEDDGDAEAAEQSEIAVPLPVTASYSYELDGEPIDPAELAGKSGHLVIRVEYASSARGVAEVKGQQTEMTVPFLAVTVLPLDGDVYSNVEVTNGKVVNTGRMSVAVCFGLPGLSEALNVGGYRDVSLDIDIPTRATISADVVDYANAGSYTVITGLPGDGEAEKLPFSVSFKGFNVDPMLAKTLLTGSAKEMLTGADALATGAETLSSGAGDLNTGAAGLSAGLTDLNAGSAALTEGADQIIGGILEDVNNTLAASAGALGETGVELNALTLDNYDAEIDRIEAALQAAAEARADGQADGADGAEGEVFQSLEALRGKLEGVKAFRDGLTSYTEAVGRAALGAATVAEGASTLDAGAADLAAGATKLNEGLKTVAGYVDGDIKQMLDRVKAVANLRYDGYMDQGIDATLFILRTEGF